MAKILDPRSRKPYPPFGLGVLLNFSVLFTASAPEMRKIISLSGTAKNCTASALFARVLFHWRVKYCINQGMEHFSGNI